jgi:transposase
MINGVIAITHRFIAVEAFTVPNIPKKSNTFSNNHYMDWHLYKFRHFVENIFARLKQFRRISTRYDKLKQNYENSVALACIFI